MLSWVWLINQGVCGPVLLNNVMINSQTRRNTLHSENKESGGSFTKTIRRTCSRKQKATDKQVREFSALSGLETRPCDQGEGSQVGINKPQVSSLTNHRGRRSGRVRVRLMVSKAQ